MSGNMPLDQGVAPVGSSSEILLTIAIPTYNRESYLEQCLGHIHRQYAAHTGSIEIIVSNNASEDGTEAVVRAFQQRGLPITYIRNAENIGADGNFAQCFRKASGKYVLVLGDDDILLEGALERIMAVLAGGEYGLVYLNSFGFNRDHLRERPPQSGSGAVVYTDCGALLTRISYWITFASGNIVNKSLLPPDFNPEEFVGTHLVQLNWVLTALFGAEKNIVIEDYEVAFKSANTGGYQLCRVFGVNMNRIFDAFIAKGIDRRYFRIIHAALLKSFFPSVFIMTKRKNSGFTMLAEDTADILTPLYKNYAWYWLITYPVMKAPYKLAMAYFKLLTFFKII